MMDFPALCYFTWGYTVSKCNGAEQNILPFCEGMIRGSSSLPQALRKKLWRLPKATGDCCASSSRMARWYMSFGEWEMPTHPKLNECLFGKICPTVGEFSSRAMHGNPGNLDTRRWFRKGLPAECCSVGVNVAAMCAPGSIHDLYHLILSAGQILCDALATTCGMLYSRSLLYHLILYPCLFTNVHMIIIL